MLFCLSPAPRDLDKRIYPWKNPYFCRSNSFEQEWQYRVSPNSQQKKASTLRKVYSLPLQRYASAPKIIYCWQRSEYVLPSFLFLPFCFANKRDLKTVARATSNCIIASSSKSSSLLLSYKRITIFHVHSQSQWIMESKERWAKTGGIKRNSIPLRNPKTWLSHFFIRLK